MNETALEVVLQECSLHALLIITARALALSGFGDVQVLDRRQSREKTRFGGFELLAETTLGTLPMRVAVKVISDAVRLRMVDELSNATKRTKCDMGIIVSPYHVTENAMKGQQDASISRIEFIDGKSLARLPIRHKIGIREKGGVDYAFFADLEVYASRIRSFLKRGVDD